MACRSADLLRLRDGDADSGLVRAGRDRLGAAARPCSAPCSSRGTLIAPMFGVAGDRIGHRTLLCAMRAAYAVLAAILMAVAFAGALTPLLVFVIAGLNGLVRPSDLGVRIALVADNIPSDQLVAAMGISRTTSDFARVGGALAGAGMFAAFGMGPAYVAVASFYALGLLFTLAIARGPCPAAGGRCVAGRLPAPVGLARSQRRARLRVVEAAAARRHVDRLPRQHDGLSAIERAAALRRQGHLPHRSDRARLSGRQLRLRRLAGVGGAHFARQRPAGAPDDPLRARLVFHAAAVRADAGPLRRRGHAGTRRLHAKPVHGDGGRPAAARDGREIPRPRHGRAHARHLQPAAGPARRRHPDRPHRLSCYGNALFRDRPAVHAPHRPALAHRPAQSRHAGERGLPVLHGERRYGLSPDRRP